MTDQEQTERGASTVPEIGQLESTEAHLYSHNATLRTDLERVTAELADVTNERDLWREQVVLVQAERDAMREVCEAVRGVRASFFWGAAPVALKAALARLDATRKATADATEEGKG